MIKKNKEVSIYGVIDERTKSIAYQGDAYSARFMLFALLADIFVRGLKLEHPLIASNWDLMLIVFIGGLISTAFQTKKKILLVRPFSSGFFILVAVLVLAAVVSLVASNVFF